MDRLTYQNDISLFSVLQVFEFWGHEFKAKFQTKILRTDELTE